ncbi:MAG: hypothetical protein WCH44_03995, partial [Betaproteobacteria bacterium]
FSAIILFFGMQIGLVAWRLQALATARDALTARRLQMEGRNAAVQMPVPSADKIKAVAVAQSMLASLSVPWEGLMGAVEAARTNRIMVESIRPRADDGSVSISISCTDFSCVAEFIKRLAQQDTLSEVALVSETLPETGSGPLRAVINANWRKFP